MRQLNHPDVEAIPLSVVLHALSDPLRLEIVKSVAANGEQCCGECGSFLPNIPKPTLSHHFKVLREAGIIHVRLAGTQRCISLRRKDLNARFPGLLAAVLRTAGPY